MAPVRVPQEPSEEEQVPCAAAGLGDTLLVHPPHADRLEQPSQDALRWRRAASATVAVVLGVGLLVALSATAASQGGVGARPPQHAFLKGLADKQAVGGHLPAGMYAFRPREVTAQTDNGDCASNDTCLVKFHNGSVIANASVTLIMYGDGVYPAFVEGSGSGTMTAFFKAIFGSPYMSWLNTDYGTGAGGRAIGLGNFSTSIKIQPVLGTSTMLRDTLLQTELQAQFDARVLPVPDDNSLYYIFLPAGVQAIDQKQRRSCVDFCAYHSVFTYADTYTNRQVLAKYVVMPDFTTGGCATGCGTWGNTFDNVCTIASNQLMGAITNPLAGLPLPVAPTGLGWVNTNLTAQGGNQEWREIGDICYAQSDVADMFRGTDGFMYAAQKVWSNSKKRCISKYV